MKFLLIFLSHCTFGKFDCVHEVVAYETYSECMEHKPDNSYAVCAAIVESDNQDPVIYSLGTTNPTGENHE